MNLLKKLLIYTIECFEEIFRKYFLKYFKTENHWIFFESEVDFSDNAYHLYDYMRKTRKGYRYIWLVNNPSLYKEYEDTIFIGKNTFRLVRNFIIMYYAHKSQYLFFTHPYWYKSVNPNQTIVNLWHGCAFKNMFWKHKHERIFDYIIVTSDKYRNQFADIFDFDKSKILDLGYPRNDYLLEYQKRLKEKQIIWMPTYRKSNSNDLSRDTIINETGLPIINTQEQLVKFNEYLKENNIKVYLKLHHLQAKNPSFQMNMSHLIALTDQSPIFKEKKLYEFVGEMDALITDYSSISFDYLLLNRPIGYTLDDYEAYEANGGFYFEDCKQLMPGHHILSFEDFLTFISDVSLGIDGYSESRQNVCKETFTYEDANSSERILTYFNL